MDQKQNTTKQVIVYGGKCDTCYKMLEVNLPPHEQGKPYTLIGACHHCQQGWLMGAFEEIPILGIDYLIDWNEKLMVRGEEQT